MTFHIRRPAEAPMLEVSFGACGAGLPARMARLKAPRRQSSSATRTSKRAKKTVDASASGNSRADFHKSSSRLPLTGTDNCLAQSSAPKKEPIPCCAS